jgi:hypothetical protein
MRGRLDHPPSPETHEKRGERVHFGTDTGGGLEPGFHLGMKTSDVTTKLWSSVPCPDCGVPASAACVLCSGGPRFDAHVNRKRSALEALERKKLARAELRCSRSRNASSMFKRKIPEVLTASPLRVPCPSCAAEVGKDCMTSKGGLSAVHLVRIKAALLVPVLPIRRGAA